MAISDMIFNHESDIVAQNHTTEHCDVAIHLHDNYEVFMALSDNIRYYVEGHSYDLKSGDIILTNQREIHRPMTVDGGAYSRKFIQFKPHLFRSVLTDSYNPLTIFEDRPLGTGNLIPADGPYSQLINTAMDVLVDCHQDQSPRSVLMMKSLLIQLFIHLHDSRLQVSSDRLPGTLPPRISAIIDHLDSHYSSRITLEDLSRLFFLDKYYMTTLFRQTTGFTIMEYLQSKRIQSAKAMIAGGTAITEVSRLCGYEDYSNFYKTFRKLTKMSPKDYRRSLGM